jgi:hypothetical protein
MSTPFPERFPDGVTLGLDLDLDAEEFYLSSGERLTEQRDQEIAADLVGATYTANITREGDWWMIHVPEIDGVTQAHDLAEAGQMARELIAVTLDVPLDTVVVSTHVTPSQDDGSKAAD